MPVISLPSTAMGPFGMPMIPGNGSSGGGGETTFGGKAITQNGNPFIFDGPDTGNAVDVMTGLRWIADGTKLVAAVQTSGVDNSYGLYEFNTTTAYSTLPSDISYNSVNFLPYNEIADADYSPKSIEFNGDGTTGYFGEDNEIFGFTMTTAYDLSTATGTGHTKTGISHSAAPYGYGAMTDLRFNSDGTKMFISEVSGNSCAILEFSLSTAYDVTTRSASPTATFNPTTASNGGGILNAIEFSADGKKMYALGPGGQGGVRFLFEYDLSTGFDISTMSYNNERVDLEALAGIDLAQSLTFNNDFSKLYIACGNDGLFQFNWGTPTGSGVSREFTGETGNNIKYSNASTGGTGDFTFEVFVEFDSVASNTTIATMGDTSVRYDAGNSRIELANSGTTANFANSTVTPEAGKFKHIATVRDGTSVNLFIDGALADTQTSNASITGDVVIGSKADGTEPVDGTMYGLRIAKEQIYTSTFTPPTTALTETPNTDLVTLQTDPLPAAKNGASAVITGTVPTASSSPNVTGGNTQAQAATFTGGISENAPGSGGAAGSAYAMASSGLTSNFANVYRLKTNGTYTIVGDNGLSIRHTGAGTTGTNKEVYQAGWAWIIRNSDGAVMKSWNGMLNGDHGDSSIVDETDTNVYTTSKFINCQWGYACGINDNYCFIGAPWRPVNTNGGAISNNNFNAKRAYLFAYKLSDFSLAKVWKVNDFASQIEPISGGPMSATFGSAFMENGIEVTNDGLYIGSYRTKSTFGNVDGGAFSYFDISDADPANWSGSPTTVVKNPINVVSSPTTNIGGVNYSNGDFGKGIKVSKYHSDNVLVVNHPAWMHRYTRSGSSFSRTGQVNPDPAVYDGGYTDISSDGKTYYVTDTTTGSQHVDALDLDNNFTNKWTYNFTTSGSPGYYPQVYMHDGADYILVGDGYDDTDGTDAGKLVVIKSDGTELKIVDNPTPNNQKFGLAFDIAGGSFVTRVLPGGTNYALQFMNGTSIFDAPSSTASQATLQSGYPVVINTITGQSTTFTNSNYHQWNNDGTKVYFGTGATGTIYEYSLSTAYDLTSTLTQVTTKTGFSSNVAGFIFNNDGTSMVTFQEQAEQYNLSTAYDISSVNNSSSQGTIQTNPNWLGNYSYGFWGDSGNKLYIGNSGYDYHLDEYTLSTPYVISTATRVGNSNRINWQTESVACHGGAIRSDGKKVYLAHNLNSDADEGIWEYDLLTAWDLSTAVYQGVFKSTSADNLGYPKWLTLIDDRHFYFQSYEESQGLGQAIGLYSMPAQQNQGGGGGGGGSGPQGWISNFSAELLGYGYPDMRINSLDVDSSDNIIVGYGSAGSHAGVVKLKSSDGTIDSSMKYGTSGATNDLRAVAVDGNDDIFTAGEGKDVWNSTDGYIFRMTSSLSKSYNSFFGQSYSDEHWDVAADNSGNAYVVGESTSYAANWSSNPKGHVVKYSSTGQVWKRLIASSGLRSYPRGVSTDGVHPYVIGKDHNQPMWIAKLDGSGPSVTWSANWGSSSAETRYMDIDTNSSGESAILMYDGNAIHVAKIDSNGFANLAAGGTPNSTDYWRRTWTKASTDAGDENGSNYEYAPGFAVKLLSNGSVALLAGTFPWIGASYRKSFYVIVWDSTGNVTVQKEFRLLSTLSGYYLNNNSAQKGIAELSDGKIVVCWNYYKGSNSASTGQGNSVFKFDPTDTTTAINGTHGDWVISDITDGTSANSTVQYSHYSEVSGSVFLDSNMSMYSKGGFQGSTNGYSGSSLTTTQGAISTLGGGGGGASPIWYGDRALFLGGSNVGNVIQYFDITNLSNAADFGDLDNVDNNRGSCSNGQRAITSGGVSGSKETIEVFNIHTLGNSQPFGNLLVKRYAHASFSDGTIGVMAGGNGGPSNSSINDIEYITIDTLGNGTDFGDMLSARKAVSGAANSTRGIIFGGWAYDNTIEYVTIATPGNSIDFGDLTNNPEYHGATGSATTAIVGGGDISPGGRTNTIQSVQFDTPGNATDFGDLTEAKKRVTATSNLTRAVFMGGSAGSGNGYQVNTIEYVTIATPSNAADFGDLLQTNQLGSATSGNATDSGLGSPLPNYDRAIFSGGTQSSGGSSPIEYMSVSNGGNAVSFGTLSTARGYHASAGNRARALMASGETGSNVYTSNIEYVVPATLGNGVSFGSDGASRSGLGSAANETYALFAGGGRFSGGWSYYSNIYYVTIATTGSASNHGSLSSLNWNVAGASGGGGYAYWAGGAPNGGNFVSTIERVAISTSGSSSSFGNLSMNRGATAGVGDNTYIIFAGSGGWSDSGIDQLNAISGGTATKVGDLHAAKYSHTSATDKTTGLFAGGYGSSMYNNIEKVTIASAGNAVDVGDLLSGRYRLAGTAGSSS